MTDMFSLQVVKNVTDRWVDAHGVCHAHKTLLCPTCRTLIDAEVRSVLAGMRR